MSHENIPVLSCLPVSVLEFYCPLPSCFPTSFPLSPPHRHVYWQRALWPSASQHTLYGELRAGEKALMSCWDTLLAQGTIPTSSGLFHFNVMVLRGFWLIFLIAWGSSPIFFNIWHFELKVNFTQGFLQNSDFTVNSEAVEMSQINQTVEGSQKIHIAFVAIHFSSSSLSLKWVVFSYTQPVPSKERVLGGCIIKQTNKQKNWQKLAFLTQPNILYPKYCPPSKYLHIA